MATPNLQETLSPREELQQQILKLSLKDKEILLGWLKATIKEEKQQAVAAQVPVKKGREVVQTLQSGTTLYRLEGVKCGKKKCKCARGQLHGPYWYAYHWKGKKMTSTYIGKKLDEAIALAAEPSEA
ncbi:DUF6788 family protein [Leptolyngbya sp. FACHB-711]|uniref:DUF6788 family protein n=1 Tax=Leptolyngbya sp. FACHB-711 TaxID=2692813 RepID=UPI0018EFF3F3|nr:DUF6788 family protein [Leptolyngbya sp. FACHB-711]